MLNRTYQNVIAAAAIVCMTSSSTINAFSLFGGSVREATICSSSRPVPSFGTTSQRITSTTTTSLFDGASSEMVDAKDAEIEELKTKLMAYQKYMADYVVKASEEKAQAVEQAVSALKAKHAEELLNLGAASTTTEAVAPPAAVVAPPAPEVKSVKVGSEVPVKVGYVGSNPPPPVPAPMSDAQLSEAKRVMASVKSIGNIDVSVGVMGEGKGDSDRKVNAWNDRNTVPDTTDLPASSMYESIMQEDPSAVAAAAQEPESPESVAALNDRNTIPDTSDLPASSLYEKVMLEDQAAVAAGTDEPGPATTAMPKSEGVPMSDGDAATTFASYTSEKAPPGPLTANPVAAQSHAKSTMARVKNIANSDVTSGILSEGKGNYDGKN